MAGRGRGRGLTLPAWMTENESEIAPSNKTEMLESCDSTQPSNFARDQFVDASVEVKSHEQNYGGSGFAGEVTPSHPPPHNQTAPMRVASGAPPPPPGPPPARNAAMAPVAGYPPMPMPMPMAYPQMFPPPAMQGGYRPPPMMSHMPPMGMGMPPGMPSGMMLPGAYPPVAPPMGSMGAPSGAVVQSTAEPPAATQPATLNDPNNDVKSWSEHEGEDGRTYWHNRATKKSTYDKPECLKCPEERSIPPCRWKEYSADGKIYYSDGTNSSWTVPEEFKEWKERVSAAVARRKAALEAAAASTSAPAQTTAAVGGSHAPQSSSRPRGGDSNKKPAPSGYAEVEVAPAVVYASKEEAVEAFRALLDDMEVGSTMKFKDVQDLCSGDARWNALRSVGERKQSLAEYQTKKMKQEKEEKKVAARRARDAFFQMLAECVAIDARSRWRDCSQQLMEDYRFKGVDNERDREEYFNDFVTELAKKERDDREKIKREAKGEFDKVLRDLLDRGVIETRSKWADVKSNLAEFLENAKFAALDETDKRRMFHDYLDELETERRNEERKKRAEMLEALDKRKADFRTYLATQFEASVLQVDVRWKDASSLVCNHDTYKELVEFTEGDASLARGAEPRDVFDAIVGDLREEARIDKRVIRDMLDQERIAIEHDTEFDSVMQALTNVVQRKRDSTEFERDKDLQVLDKILSSRLQSLRRAYDDVHDAKVKVHEEDLRHRQKREDRYLDLLDDYYYRSDHVDITWEEAKKELDRHSAYRDLDRSDRRKLFDAHMDELQEKLNGKLKKQGTTVTDKRGTESGDDDYSKSPHKRKASESDLGSGCADREQDSNGAADDGSRDDDKATRHTSKKSRTRDIDGESKKGEGRDDEGDVGERHRSRHSGRKSSHRDSDDKDKHRRKRSHRDDGSGDEDDDDDRSTASRSRKRSKDKKEKKDKDRDKDRDRKHKHKHKKDRSSSRSPHDEHRSSRDRHKSKKARSRS